MRVVVYGDSFAYGTGLPDCLDQRQPSKLTYGEHLSNMLNCECVNLSQPGSSNKEILFKILTTRKVVDDVVIVMWSHPHRTCVLRKHLPMPTNEAMGDKLGWWLLEEPVDPVAEAYYKYLYDEYDSIQNSWQYINHADAVLNVKARHVIHSVIPNTSEFTHDDAYPKWSKVSKIKAWKEIDHTECGHAGPKSHKQLAKYLFSQIS